MSFILNAGAMPNINRSTWHKVIHVNPFDYFCFGFFGHCSWYHGMSPTGECEIWTTASKYCSECRCFDEIRLQLTPHSFLFKQIWLLRHQYSNWLLLKCCEHNEMNCKEWFYIRSVRFRSKLKFSWQKKSK